MEKDIHIMRGMASKGIFESKSGIRERGAILQNIAGDLEQMRIICSNSAKSQTSFYHPYEEVQVKQHSEKSNLRA